MTIKRDILLCAPHDTPLYILGKMKDEIVYLPIAQLSVAVAITFLEFPGCKGMADIDRSSFRDDLDFLGLVQIPNVPIDKNITTRLICYSILSVLLNHEVHFEIINWPQFFVIMYRSFADLYYHSQQGRNFYEIFNQVLQKRVESLIAHKDKAWKQMQIEKVLMITMHTEKVTAHQLAIKFLAINLFEQL